MAFQQIKPGYIDASGTSNGQILASNGTSVYWTTGGTGYTGSEGYTGSIGSIGYTGSKGATGDFGGAAFNYVFSTNTTHTSTPNGYFNFNNTSFASATTLFIDYIDALGANSYSFLQTIDDSTSAIKGHFSVRDTANSLNYVMFAITGTHTEDVDHFDVPVSYLSGVTSFTNGTNTVITFARTGNIGDTGYTGSKGDIGYTGSVGFTGSTGAGYDGSQGSVGYTGSAGVGYTGSAGSGGGGGASVSISATAPVSANTGDLWWSSESGTLYIYYNDGDTSQWVTASSQNLIGFTGSAGSGGISTGKSIAMSMIFGG